MHPSEVFLFGKGSRGRGGGYLLLLVFVYASFKCFVGEGGGIPAARALKRLKR